MRLYKIQLTVKWIDINYLEKHVTTLEVRVDQINNILKTLHGIQSMVRGMQILFVDDDSNHAVVQIRFYGDKGDSQYHTHTDKIVIQSDTDIKAAYAKITLEANGKLQFMEIMQ